MVIEANLPEGDDLFMSDKRPQIVERSRREFRSVLRMHPDRSIDLFVTISEPYGPIDLRRSVAGTDRQDPRHSGGRGTLQNRIQIFRKPLVVQMTMRIDQRHYFNREPTGTSSRKPARTGLPPSRDAATIMPFDSIPRIFRGCRLATMTTLRPIIFSGS